MVLIEQSEYESESSLLLTDDAKRDMRPQEGLVLALGPDVPEGHIQVGDSVIFTRWGGQEWPEGGKSYRLCSFGEHVLAAIEA